MWKESHRWPINITLNYIMNIRYPWSPYLADPITSWVDITQPRSWLHRVCNWRSVGGLGDGTGRFELGWKGKRRREKEDGKRRGEWEFIGFFCFVLDLFTGVYPYLAGDAGIDSDSKYRYSCRVLWENRWRMRDCECRTRAPCVAFTLGRSLPIQMHRYN